MPDWLLPVATLIMAVATPFLAWWGSSRYFTGQFEQWRANSEEWRHRTDNRLDAIDHTIQAGSWPALVVRVARTEQDVLELRRWKHEKVDAYIPRAVDDLERRISRLEEKQ